MAISVDTANKQIKTEHFVFQSGLNEMDIMSPKLDTKVLEYNGKFYPSSNRRIAYMKDKTFDERYYILLPQKKICIGYIKTSELCNTWFGGFLMRQFKKIATKPVFIRENVIFLIFFRL